MVETRVGLSRARNAGIDAATGELIAFLDDDAIADSAWLSRHSEVLADESLTASTGRDLPIERKPGRITSLPAASTLASRRSSSIAAAQGGLSARTLADSGPASTWSSSAGLSIRGCGSGRPSARGADIWGVRGALPLLYDDQDGARIAYVPDAVVRHGRPDPSGGPASRRTARDVSRARAAYLTMLLVEEPEFRRRTVRYMLQGFRGQRLPWRPRHPTEPSQDAGGWGLWSLRLPAQPLSKALSYQAAPRDQEPSRKLDHSQACRTDPIRGGTRACPACICEQATTDEPALTGPCEGSKITVPPRHGGVPSRRRGPLPVPGKARSHPALVGGPVKLHLQAFSAIRPKSW